MSTEESRKLIGAYLETFNHDWEGAIERYVADTELEQHIRFFEQPLPGYQLEAHDVLADGDRVAVRATVRGIHRGELMGVAATGREVVFPLFIIYRLAGGRIVEHWMLADQPGLMQQITTESAGVGT